MSRESNGYVFGLGMCAVLVGLGCSEPSGIGDVGSDVQGLAQIRGMTFEDRIVYQPTIELCMGQIVQGDDVDAIPNSDPVAYYTHKCACDGTGCFPGQFNELDSANDLPQWVSDEFLGAIEETWGEATGIEFVDGECSPDDANIASGQIAVRFESIPCISRSDAGSASYTVGISTHYAADPTTRRYTYVHEMGHALGLNHEHNHPYAPTHSDGSPIWCDGGEYVSAWAEPDNFWSYANYRMDWHSIMNYCAADLSGDLSFWDAAVARRMYQQAPAGSPPGTPDIGASRSDPPVVHTSNLAHTANGGVRDLGRITSDLDVLPNVAEIAENHRVVWPLPSWSPDFASGVIHVPSGVDSFDVEFTVRDIDADGAWAVSFVYTDSDVGQEWHHFADQELPGDFLRFDENNQPLNSASDWWQRDAELVFTRTLVRSAMDAPFRMRVHARDHAGNLSQPVIIDIIWD